MRVPARLAARIGMVGGLVLSCSPWGSPPAALALGLLYGLSGLGGTGIPSGTSASRPRAVRRWTNGLLQFSIVMLGFGFDLGAVLVAGRRGLVYTAAGIAGALLIGHALARLLRVEATPALLIGVGTAICGGSAIAAVGPAIEANDEDLSVALGTVFVLNAAALFLFPLIGGWLALSQTQFGLWAALAIHDTSSVVGAGLRYGPTALTTATTVKLARALWIVPVTLGAAGLRRAGAHGSHIGRVTGVAGDRPMHAARGPITLPWFVLGFVAAAGLARFVPQPASAYALLAHTGTLGLCGALFLVGTQVTRETLRRVGWRALALGLLLWLIVASLSLWGVRSGLIAL